MAAQWSCSQSAGRAGTGVFNRHVRQIVLCGTICAPIMHNHPTFTLLLVSAALLRHNKLFSFSRVVLRSIVALDLALVPFTRISRQYSQSHNLSVSGQTTQGASTATDPIDKATPDRCREIVHRESICSELTKLRNLSNDDDGFQLLTIV